MLTSEAETTERLLPDLEAVSLEGTPAVAPPALTNDSQDSSSSSEEIATHHWIVFGVCLWASLSVMYVIFADIVPFLFEVSQWVYYPIGLGCCLIFQQKLEKTYPTALASARCACIEKDAVCALWLIFLFFLIHTEDVPYLSVNFMLAGFLSFINIFFFAMSGVSIVWIASRKTYLATKQWRLARDETRRKSIALRATLIVGLAVIDWARAVAYNSPGNDNLVGISVVTSVEIALASATLVGAAAFIRQNGRTWIASLTRWIEQLHGFVGEFQSGWHRQQWNRTE